MATANPNPPKPDDAEATGRKIYGVFASTQIEPNIEFGKAMWKNLPKLMGERIIKVSWGCATAFWHISYSE